jgi:hypothetical protein
MGCGIHNLMLNRRLDTHRLPYQPSVGATRLGLKLCRHFKEEANAI